MKTIEFNDLPIGPVFKSGGGLVLLINGEPKVKLRKNDSFGRVMFQGKEMLYADKRFTKKESDYYCGAKGTIYNCFIEENKNDCAGTQPTNKIIYQSNYIKNNRRIQIWNLK